jgi:hypothetical protein
MHGSIKQECGVNKWTLIERYPMFGDPAFWIFTAGGLIVAIGFIIIVEPWVSYVDHFPFNRNWSTFGHGIVTKYQGPCYSRLSVYYVAHFTYIHSGEEYTSQCFFGDCAVAYTAGDCVPLLSYKGNPHVVKIKGSLRIRVGYFYLGCSVPIVILITLIGIVRSFPGKKRKKKRRRRRGKLGAE